MNRVSTHRFSIRLQYSDVVTGNLQVVFDPHRAADNPKEMKQNKKPHQR
ncbi:MAG TPA: hypothetical protein H9825_02370 [Candidatus Sphingobacterium stercorigallinarum]|nr:hypothetical protein [Candidatus Sphingobacterium stercorigallinarum]